MDKEKILAMIYILADYIEKLSFGDVPKQDIYIALNEIIKE